MNQEMMEKRARLSRWIPEVKSGLDKSSTQYQEVGGSIYVRDPNRLNLELLLMEGVGEVHHEERSRSLKR